MRFLNFMRFEAEKDDGSSSNSESSGEKELEAAPGERRPSDQSGGETDENDDVDAAIDDEYPDGGLQAWINVLGGFCCYFCSFGWQSSIGVFQTYYEQNTLRGYNASDISWILSVQVFVLSGIGPICGKIFDSYGCRGLILVGTFMEVFGLMMLSLSTTYWEIFLAQSLCSGIGAAAVFQGAINAVSTWFLKRRGTAFGIVASGASVGSVIVPILFDQRVHVIGFGWTLRAIAFMYLGLQLIAIFTLRSRLQHKPKPWNMLEFLKPFGDRRFVFNAIGCFFVQLGIMIPFNFIALASETSGVSPSLANNLIPIINGASWFGRIFPLWASDYLGRFNTMIAFSLFGAIISLALWIPAGMTSSASPTIAFAALFGLPLGAFAGLLPVLIGQISEIREIGLRVGATFFVIAFAGLIGNPVAGALAGLGKGSGKQGQIAAYTDLKIFCGLSIAVGAVFLIAARLDRGGYRIWKY